MTATRLCACWCALCPLLAAQEPQSSPSQSKEARKQEKKLQKELQTPYKKWIEEDVSQIITDEERQAFYRLQTDDEREQFVEQFWLRRDPTPNTAENEFKEEHYRRIAYANEHFASGIQGWKTDRGRIYIVYGPPDEIESHPSGGPYQRPVEQGGGSMTTFPFELWRYRYLDELGNNVIIEFVDDKMSGEYRMTLNPEDKNALAHTPMQGSSQPTLPLTASSKEFDALHQYDVLQKPPKVPFKDLEALVNSTIRYNTLPMKARADFIRLTDSTVLTPVTIQFENADLEFREQDGASRATVNLYMRVTSMTGRTVAVDSDTIAATSPTEMLAEFSRHPSVYQKGFYLHPGAYRLSIVAKDVNNGNVNTFDMALRVPQFDPTKLTMSSVILADSIGGVETRTVGAGPFVIGDRRVRPCVNAVFTHNDHLGIYFQLYGAAGVRPQGILECRIVKNGSTQAVFELTEDLGSMHPGAGGEQLTIEKTLPLQSLHAGQYTLKISVRASNGAGDLTQTAGFEVR